MGNHTEALQIDFDPAQITLEEIVDLFWKSHDPLRAIRSRQYMTAIWFHNEAQAHTIDMAKAAIEQKLDATILTPVMSLDVFYLAEEYHQKYRLQHSPLMKSFNEMYPDFTDFNNSTAAARLNGFVSGHGSQQLFDDEYKAYGIPVDELRQAIRIHELSGTVARCSGDHCSIG